MASEQPKTLGAGADPAHSLSSSPPPPLNTLGTVTRSCAADGIYISEVSLPPRLQLRPHKHALAQICLVLDGRYIETARGRRVALQPGSTIIRPPGEVHANSFGDEETHALLIDVEPDRYGTLKESLRADAPVYFRPGALGEVWRELQAELRQADESTRLALQGLVLLLASRAARLLRQPRQGARPAWYERALRLIDESYTENIGLSTVAAAVSVHPVSLAAAFRRYKGVSVGEYISALRVEHARGRLLASDSSVGEIAHAAGFYDQSHFGRAFKRRYGMSPAQFRRARGLCY